jgi:hypothetical protein
LFKKNLGFAGISRTVSDFLGRQIPHIPRRIASDTNSKIPHILQGIASDTLEARLSFTVVCAVKF